MTATHPEMPLILYCALIVLISTVIPLATVWLWVGSRKFRQIRRPVKERMLRSAGTSLRQKLADLDDDLMIAFFAAIIMPTFLGFVLVTKPDWFRTVTASDMWGGLVIAMLASTALNFWLLSIARRRSDYMLGHNGELAVSEHLQELARAGCYVFHDLQPDKTWNIDHIVVAPDSVLVIETKARRMRGRGKPEPAHEVIFDGKQLHFPNWSDTHGLAQAERNADWVRGYLSKALGEPLLVEPVLTLPGWMVHRKGRGKVYVVNPKQIKALVRARGAHAIPPEKTKRMAQIAFALEQKCRDVEF